MSTDAILNVLVPLGLLAVPALAWWWETALARRQHEREVERIWAEALDRHTR